MKILNTNTLQEYRSGDPKVRCPIHVALATIGMLGALLLATGLTSHFGFPSMMDASLTDGLIGLGASMVALSLIVFVALRIFKPQSMSSESAGNENLNSLNASPTLSLKPFPHEDRAQFSTISSGNLVECNLKNREEFLADLNEGGHYPPPVISASPFVPEALTRHLYTQKKKTALGVKYVEGDAITNGEGALATFTSPFANILMKGDYCWKRRHDAEMLPEGYARNVVLNGSYHPDFEDSQVMLQLLRLHREAVLGADLTGTEFEIPSVEEKSNPTIRRAYDKQLFKHMIYHLTKGHRLPAKSETTQMSLQEAIQFLANLVHRENFNPDCLVNRSVKVGGYALSLEAFFNVYKEQMRNQFSALEALLPQGYVYTISPPSIFMRLLGSDATLANRLMILALKHLAKNAPLENLKMIAFGEYQDKEAVSLLQAAMPSSVQVVSKSHIFKRSRIGRGNGLYEPETPDWALVISNNSDAFGQNIQNERFGGSLDGVVGAISSAACVLHQEGEHLFDLLF